MRYLFLLALFLSSCAHGKYLKVTCKSGRMVHVKTLGSNNPEMNRVVLNNRIRTACERIDFHMATRDEAN